MNKEEQSNQSEGKEPNPFLSNEEILALYSYWSEETYAAGFISPNEETVRRFRKWLSSLRIQYNPANHEDYENEMLKEYRKQEREEGKV